MTKGTAFSECCPQYTERMSEMCDKICNNKSIGCEKFCNKNDPFRAALEAWKLQDRVRRREEEIIRLIKKEG